MVCKRGRQLVVFFLAPCGNRVWVRKKKNVCMALKIRYGISNKRLLIDWLICICTVHTLCHEVHKGKGILIGITYKNTRTHSNTLPHTTPALSSSMDVCFYIFLCCFHLIFIIQSCFRSALVCRHLSLTNWTYLDKRAIWPNVAFVDGNDHSLSGMVNCEQ